MLDVERVDRTWVSLGGGGGGDGLMFSIVSTYINLQQIFQKVLY